MTISQIQRWQLASFSVRRNPLWCFTMPATGRTYLSLPCRRSSRGKPIDRGVTILAQALDDAINRRVDAIRVAELSAGSGSGSDCERGQASAQTGVVVDAYDTDPRHWLIWDGTCGFCRRSSEWFARLDVRGEFRIVPYQDCPSPPMTPALRAASARAVQVVQSDGTVVSGGRAVIFLLREVGWHPRVMAIAARPPLVWLVEIGYRTVAKNRQFFSRLLFRDHSRHLDRPE